MGAMAETLLGKGGRLFFYIVLLVCWERDVSNIRELIYFGK